MKLKTKFIVLITAIHIIMLIFSLQLLNINKFLFLGSELLILFSIILSIQLYKSFIRPINLISAGIESLKDKDFSMKFLPVGQTEMDQLVSVYNEMIETMREERIRQEEQHFFLQRLIEASPTGIIVLDYDDCISTMNPAAESLLKANISDTIGLRLDQIVHPLIIDLQALTEGQKRTISRNGLEMYACQKSFFLDRGFSKQFILIEELSEEIRQIEKQSYEKVIRMMSHEINNSIGAVNSIMESFKIYSQKLNQLDKQDFDDGLTVVTKRNNRLNTFMKNFSDVVRIPEPNLRDHDLVELLKTVQRLVQVQLKKRKIILEMHVPEKYLLKMDAEQIEQVLLNIVKNAYEAIESDGKIIIKMDLEIQTLIISNSGSGIPSDIQNKLFTPFFSSKRDGQGIGLTIIREILHNHQWKFSLESCQNVTNFTIELKRK